jgi:hypothetical protein
MKERGTNGNPLMGYVGAGPQHVLRGAWLELA